MPSGNRLIASTFFFAIGWFTISFTFPLEARAFGFNANEIGFFGFAVSLPFPLVAFLYLRTKVTHTRGILIVNGILISVLSLMFMIEQKSLFIWLLVATGFLQSIFWITAEISMTSIRDDRIAERYTAAWGVPNFISPFVAGYLLQIHQFKLAAALSGALLFISVLFVQDIKIERHPGNGTSFRPLYIFPLFSAGMTFGFFAYVLLPLLKGSSYSYQTLGIFGSAIGGSMAITTVILSFVRYSKIVSLSMIASVLMALPGLIAISINPLLILLVLIGAGVGIAIAFSKILSYAIRTEKPVQGIFYYELFLALGYSAGSGVGGMISGPLGYLTAAVVFAVPLLYLFFLMYGLLRRKFSLE